MLYPSELQPHVVILRCYTGIMLNESDEKKIGKMIFDNVLEALEQAVLPRLYNLEEDVKGVKEDIGGLKADVVGLKEDVRDLRETVGGLVQAVEILDNDMGGVKMRLTSIEKKIDDRTDTFFVVKNHEKRILKLEEAVV